MPYHFTFPGCYGSGHTPCQVHAVRVSGGWWYAVAGSRNVNYTAEDLRSMGRVDVESVSDIDFFYSARPIEDPADIESQLEE